MHIGVCRMESHLLSSGSRCMERGSVRYCWERNRDQISKELQMLNESYLELPGYLCGQLTPLGLAGLACGVCICPPKPWRTFSGIVWSAIKLSSEVYEGKALNPVF